MKPGPATSAAATSGSASSSPTTYIATVVAFIPCSFANAIAEGVA